LTVILPIDENKLKHFIITIDTEGDNLWEYNQGEPIKTENARYIPRFQALCDKFNFMPVYLVNYEMAQDNYFCNFAKDALGKNKCEIGIHLHAWNNPPHYELPKGGENGGLPYLIEYPRQSMLGKFTVLHKLLIEKFNTEIVSHRSGRWAMNQDYFDILIDNGIKIDCSVTPHASWESSPGFSKNSKGSNYLHSPENPYLVRHSSNSNNILEVPVTIRKLRHFSLGSVRHPRTFIKNMMAIVTGKAVWLRPRGNNLQDMLALVQHIKNSNDEYLMFMLHSSELMPNGSPAFKTEDSIERLYADLQILFERISSNFTGITFKEYLARVDKHGL
jgi:hypothetical protein